MIPTLTTEKPTSGPAQGFMCEIIKIVAVGVIPLASVYIKMFS